MDELQRVRQALQQVSNLADDAWQDFEGLLVRKQFKKDEFLIREGQVENQLYFLLTGATRNYFLREGKEFTVDFHFAGDFVTAFYSFITRQPSPIFITLLEDTETMAISHEAMQAYYLRHASGERTGRQMAEYQYVRRLKKEMDLLSLTAEERYQELLKKNPVLINSLSVKHLSSYLGIQPESLSRIRKVVSRN
jgi:CRP-like cAMP-binding protein